MYIYIQKFLQLDSLLNSENSLKLDENDHKIFFDTILTRGYVNV